MAMGKGIDKADPEEGQAVQSVTTDGSGRGRRHLRAEQAAGRREPSSRVDEPARRAHRALASGGRGGHRQVGAGLKPTRERRAITLSGGLT